MTKRIQWFQVAPDLGRALLDLQDLVNASGLEHALLELVKMRASQLNGCAFCLDMHSKDARAAGEGEQRLYLLSAWREAAHLYSARERAALTWTEAVTNVCGSHVPDEAYEEARAQFSETELVHLTFAITQINTWNRLSVAFRTEAGGYRPGMFARTKTA
jgi:AhpD family alkylhydroperoxidase